MESLLDPQGYKCFEPDLQSSLAVQSSKDPGQLDDLVQAYLDRILQVCNVFHCSKHGGG